MKKITRKALRRRLLKIISEEYEMQYDPAQLFKGQTELLRGLNDDIEAAKGGTYASFVNFLQSNIKDQKVRALLNSGLFDGNPDDDKVEIQEIDIPVTQLLPTQKEIGLADSLGWASENNPQGAAELAAAEPGKVADVGGRIITADGRFIIDGHHRWSQVYLLNPKAKIPAYNIVAPDSPIPGQSATKDGPDFLKMAQISIAAVDGVVPQVDADTATDIYRTGGDPDKIRDILKGVIPQGSKFASTLESMLFGPSAAPGAPQSEQGDAMFDAANAMPGEEPILTSDDLGKETQSAIPGPKDEEGKVLSTGKSGDVDEEKLSLNELFGNRWIELNEFFAATPGGGTTGGYDQVIDRIVNNAIQLYSGTAEAASAMTARSEMPQFDKGGSKDTKKLDALKSGQIDWNPPYDESDMDNSATAPSRKDIAINEADIKRMIRNSILKQLNS